MKFKKKKLARVFFNAVRKMECVERAVEIGKIIQAHNTEQIITRFYVLCMHFHVNLCSRGSCCTCKFVNEFVTFLLRSDSSTEEVLNFKKHCRLNQKECYGLHSCLKTLAEEERKKVNLNSKVKNLVISNDGKQN